MIADMTIAYIIIYYLLQVFLVFPCTYLLQVFYLGTTYGAPEANQLKRNVSVEGTIAAVIL